jgi:hypothetical protein
MGFLTNIIAFGLIICMIPSSTCNNSYRITTGIENGNRFFLINNGRESNVRAITVFMIPENSYSTHQCVWGAANEGDYISGKVFYGIPLAKSNPNAAINICFDKGHYKKIPIPLEKGREYELEIETSSSDTYTKFRFKH